VRATARLERGDRLMAAPRPMGGTLLEVRDVALRFGGIVALDGVSFELEEGQILGLIGPNGAGKTTLFNCLSRLYTPNRGDILFEGRSLLDRPPYRIAEIGIARTFQNLALFAPQSVLDNVRIGAHAHSRSDFVSDTLRLPWARRQETAVSETAWSLLHMLDLADVALADRRRGGRELRHSHDAVARRADDPHRLHRSRPDGRPHGRKPRQGRARAARIRS